MHPAVLEWVGRHASGEPVTVLDIGGRDINGTPRALFPRAVRYEVLDLREGPNVDIVADAATWQPDREYDVVVCTEVFEHTGSWPDICRTAFRALTPGGMLIVTCAGPGRWEHSGIDGMDRRTEEHYLNVTAVSLAFVLNVAGFVDIETDSQDSPADTRAVAIKPGG